jgi:hypothetical protein
MIVGFTSQTLTPTLARSVIPASQTGEKMNLRQCVFCVFAAAAGFVNQVQAQPVRSCPDGQAVSSLNPNGTPVQCIPVPPPVNLAPLEMAIVQESAERKQADADLRASINETKISGTYAYSGSQICLTSTTGFREDLTPMPSTDPARAAVVFPSTAYATGFRTFNEDGTGSVELSAQVVTHPTIFVTNTGFAGVGTIVEPPNPGRPSGAVSTARQTGSFTWRVADGKLLIADASPLSGLFDTGANKGCTVSAEGVPPMVGVLGKDLRTISLAHDGVAVERNTITCSGVTVSSSPRICHRQRLLQKM